MRAARQRLAWSWWLTEWGVDVRLAADGGGEEELAAAAADLDGILAPVTYSRAPISLPEALQALLTVRGATLAVAESCTAGLVGGALTEAPGSSAFFRGGVIAYADAVKRELLGVPAELLDAHGAVSGPVAEAMAAGARARLGSDYAVAVTGIAGPDGGSAEKPVGTTWIAVATPAAVFARRYRFTADRARNRRLTVAAAVDGVRRVLEAGDAAAPWRDDDTWSRP
ncbi:MAG: CinA family protein [Krumholzibacteria bacterium]|nr:CinA family protein [Candidatus Krumholzibacteria bacterium]